MTHVEKFYNDNGTVKSVSCLVDYTQSHTHPHQREANYWLKDENGTPYRPPVLAHLTEPGVTFEGHELFATAEDAA